MQGRRRPDITADDWFGKYPGEDLAPGDYYKWGQIMWGVKTPNGEEGMISLRRHTVIEHEDGSITVSPSILIEPHNSFGKSFPGWHGWLERGMWRSC